MSKSENLTQKWLRQNVQTYPSADLVYAHTDALLARHPTIRPKTDVYTYDDGRTQLLLCLHGLLPISFRGASYNIPIAVWIPREYPRTPPLAYVVPTTDMLVRPGPDMDMSGRCLIPYVRNWERKFEGCSLLALFDAMQDAFSRQPPVYAKPKDVTAQQPPPSRPASSAPDYAARPPPPLPTERHYAHSPAPPTYSPHNRSASVDLPPHPAAWPAGAQSNPALNLNQPRSQPPYRAAPQTSPPPPPPPPLPPAIPALVSNSAPSAFRAVSPPSAYASPVSAMPTGQGHASYGPPPFAAPQPGSIPAGHAYVSPPPSAQPPPPPFPPAFAPPAAASPPHSVPPPDLLDAEDDAAAGPSTATPAPAPPRPPNPELLRLHDEVHAKVSSELASLSQAMALDSERLRANQADLLAGEPAIRDEMARLEAVRDVCRGVAARLEQVVAAGERNVAELKRKGDPEVDELVCSTTIVYNQLVNLVAEDNAIEDTIYHLHRALNAGRIDLERFLRTTRVLAEEQFMKRALIEKIQAGIAGGGGGGGSEQAAWAVPSGLR
ncbi:UEV domain-containing protein [Trametes elegans]|nr:UEV domain-containing protein [Trametes elegans]